MTCYLLSPLIGYRVSAFVLLLAVSFSALVFNLAATLLAAVLSAFIWNFFFIPPRFTLHVDNAEDGILLAMYFLIALVSGVLTNRIRKAENIARLKEERANSVTLYNTLLDSLSHELRTPISVIIAASDNLLARGAQNGENEMLIREISKASLRLDQQVENLLNISRLESGHIKARKEWCDIVELCYSVAYRVEADHPGRRIGVHVNPDLPLCKTDKGMLDQVLFNLLNNAARHTQPHCQISLQASCYGSLLEFEVKDTGQGFGDMDPEEVFSKFSRQNKGSARVSGLGLSIVKGFTEALGGEVSLQKDQRNGSHFRLTFPVQTSNYKGEAIE